MKIGVISDIHDHLPHLDQALNRLQETQALLCCGDLCSPFVMKALGERYERPIHIVFGNNDGDLFRLTQTAAKRPQITLHGEIADLEIGGLRIVMTHFDTIAAALATTNAFDFVCFGHNHKKELRQTERATLLNPGEVYGGLTGEASCAVIDAAARQAEHIKL